MDQQKIRDDAGKENMSLVNKMREYQDPLLKAFDQIKDDISDEESGSEEGSSEEEVTVSDIKFPKDNAQELLQFIMRDLNNLSN